MAQVAESPVTSPPLTVADDAARRHVRDVVAKARSSFFWPMLFLPKARREGMFAVYAFCREVDDIADEPAPLDRKRAELAAWRAEIERLYAGTPSFPTARALRPAVAAYGLRKADFLALIDGMESDAEGPMIAPTLAELELYCSRVASAVGQLSVRVFGAREPEAETVAFELGQALQLTNILRDLGEDAERDRLYLPREYLERQDVPLDDVRAALDNPGLAGACHELANLARTRFANAEAALAHCACAPMRPAIAMMHVYRRILARLEAGGFADPYHRVSLSAPEKIFLVLRYGLF
jgi:phytoene synthase